MGRAYKINVKLCNSANWSSYTSKEEVTIVADYKASERESWQRIYK